MSDVPQAPAPAVLVTGASTGIGASCALDLDRRGFRVFAGIRRTEDGCRLQQQASPRLEPVTIDVTDTAAIAAAAETIAAKVGAAGLKGLVNNAGIVVTGPLEIVPLEQIRRQFEVNVLGQIAVTQAMLPMIRTATGRIVNVGSINGFVSPPFFGPYAASKFALEALSDSLRVELRHWGILVSIVEPGGVRTPIWEKSRAGADRDYGSLTPAQRELYAEDLAAVFAASERLAQKAAPVEPVVRAIHHALTARRPRTRYPVGWSARMMQFFSCTLHDRARDFGSLLALGLRRTGKTKYRF